MCGERSGRHWVAVEIRSAMSVIAVRICAKAGAHGADVDNSQSVKAVHIEPRGPHPLTCQKGQLPDSGYYFFLGDTRGRDYGAMKEGSSGEERRIRRQH
jgi:hypothetical protein